MVAIPSTQPSRPRWLRYQVCVPILIIVSVYLFYQDTFDIAGSLASPRAGRYPDENVVDVKESDDDSIINHILYQGRPPIENDGSIHPEGVDMWGEPPVKANPFLHDVTDLTTQDDELAEDQNKSGSYEPTIPEPGHEHDYTTPPETAEDKADQDSFEPTTSTLVKVLTTTSAVSSSSTQSGSLMSSEELCKSAPRSPDIMVILKTGATELATKLPTHLLTLAHCIEPGQLLLFSDQEDTFVGHQIHDAVQHVSAERQSKHDEFKHYQLMKSYRSRGLDLNLLRGQKGWDLDKWKFLPLTFQTYERAPAHIKWFFFIEADTSVSWLNLLLWLEKLDPSEEHYLGAIKAYGPGVFAHGGSGYIMSRPALAKLAAHRQAEGPAKYDVRWEDLTATACCGDEIVARALRETNVTVSNGDPMLQSENLKSVDLTKSKLCKPMVTMHHVAAMDINDLWRYQGEWVGKHGWGKPYLWRDIYERYVAAAVEHRRKADWDNLSNHMRFIDPKEATDDEKKEDRFIEYEDMDDLERKGLRSADVCAELCDIFDECVQWRWKPGRCHLGEAIIQGAPTEEPGDREWVSGWHQRHIKQYLSDLKDCQ